MLVLQPTAIKYFSAVVNPIACRCLVFYCIYNIHALGVDFGVFAVGGIRLHDAIKLGDFFGADAFRPGYLFWGAGELGQRGGFVGFGCSGIFGGVFGVLLCFVAILAKGGGEPCAFIVALAFAVGAKDLMGFGVTARVGDLILSDDFLIMDIFVGFGGWGVAAMYVYYYNHADNAIIIFDYRQIYCKCLIIKAIYLHCFCPAWRQCRF